MTPMHSIRRATRDDIPFLVEVVVSATRAQGRLAPDFDEVGFRAGFTEETAGQIADSEADSVTSVIADLIAEATSSGRSLCLSVETDNPRARRLYPRLGFVDTGRTEAEITMAYRPDASDRGGSG